MSRYTPSPAQTTKRENNFTYHRPTEDQPVRYTDLRTSAAELSRLFDENCPESRELSCAQTKLEEAVFWANAAIARNEGSAPCVTIIPRPPLNGSPVSVTR